MPLINFMIPGSYVQVRSVNFDIDGRTIQFNIGVWEDNTKTNFLNNITYIVNASDSLWDTYFEIFCPKNDLTDAIDDYLEARTEFTGATKIE